MSNKINQSKSKKINKKQNINLAKIMLVLGIIIIVIVVFNLNKGMSNKEKSELYSLYNTEEQKSEFLVEMDRIQTAIGIYLINNTTLDSESFEDSVAVINSTLKKNDWSILEIEKKDLYKGEYSIDEDGKLKFKFENKDIEPLWANENEFVVLNK